MPLGPEHESAGSAVGEQFYREVHALVRRYSHESDMTAWEAIACLEAVKFDMFSHLAKIHEQQND